MAASAETESPVWNSSRNPDGRTTNKHPRRPSLTRLATASQAQTHTRTCLRAALDPSTRTRATRHNQHTQQAAGATRAARLPRTIPPHHLHRRAAFSLFLPSRPFRPAPCRRPTCPPSLLSTPPPRPSLPPLPSSAAFSLLFLAEAATNQPEPPLRDSQPGAQHSAPPQKQPAVAAPTTMRAPPRR
jgi:hypothetical protein